MDITKDDLVKSIRDKNDPNHNQNKVAYQLMFDHELMMAYGNNLFFYYLAKQESHPVLDNYLLFESPPNISDFEEVNTPT